ncbi:MAG: 4Fe-4S dicluster domain-containing protein [Lachnospiraceae bacterium]|nr:4Fe-4S dicluster domain-containing protein [Lachnospiraceae bacterium]
MFADENVIKVKHEILYEVAKLAFAGELEEKKGDLPYKLHPGPKPDYRCCIYREREIARERIELALGRTLTGNADNIIQVIRSACEDCPISSYTVTENCQNCMGKACVNACKFGAVEPGRDRSHIDAQKCKECGRCAESCPYNAIAHLVRPCKNSCPVGAISYDEDGISVIDEEKCIRCGKCIHSCPFGAIGSKTFIVDVIEALKSDKKVFAIVAPASEGMFGPDRGFASWNKAMKAIGFDGFYEVGLGADMTAYAEAKEWLEAVEKGDKKVTSCCPAFVNYVKRHFPELKGMISQTVSPMCATSRMIKRDNPGAVVVFIGPCIAKKSEVVDEKIEGNADYVLTYSEIRAILRAKDLRLEPCDEKFDQQASVFGKRFGNAGGVTAAVLESMKELGCKECPEVYRADGVAECKKALLLMKAGKLPENFIEGMVCEGGCVGGPSAYSKEISAKKCRDELIAKADSRRIDDNLKSFSADSVEMDKN